MESEALQSRNVFLWKDSTWQQLNPLNIRRLGHACGRFTLQNGTEVVIVAGGETGHNMASDIRRIEIYNLQVRLSE